MTIFNSVKLSLRGLRASKKRALLTMLGIIIGVSSVIMIMSVGAGAQSLIVNEINSFGSNLFGVMPGATSDNGPPASVMGITVTTLKLKELDDLRRLPHVKAVTAYVRGVDTVSYANQKIETTFVGTTADLPRVESGQVISGRFFNSAEVNSLARVAVLGYQVKQDFFGTQTALGKKIRLKGQNFKIIGVIEKLGTVAFENKDKLIYVPISTAQKILLGIHHVSLIRGAVDDSQNMELVAAEVKKTIRRHHHIKNPADDDFTVRTVAQALGIITSITDALRMFLAALAAISLIVGGIGIMNIMLINVTERTKEIGLRKAVGATYGNILEQFLIEASTLTLIGGLIGILGGIGVAWLVAWGVQSAGYQWDFIITLPSVLLGFGVSLAIGLIFGSYPASQAAHLEPVEALGAE